MQIMLTSEIISEPLPSKQGLKLNSNQFQVAKQVKDGTLVAEPTWFGSNLGTIKKINDITIGLEINIDNALGICKIEYQSEYDLWKLTPPANIPDEYAIVILITCEE